MYEGFILKVTPTCDLIKVGVTRSLCSCPGPTAMMLVPKLLGVLSGEPISIWNALMIISYQNPFFRDYIQGESKKSGISKNNRFS